MWALLLGLLVLSSAAVRAQSPVDAFDPGYGPTETVHAVAAQRNGRVLIGGQFTGVAGQPVAGVARLNADGTLDPAFRPQTNGTVHALAVQADGKVLVGGSFSEVGGQARSGLARVNADGTLDNSFNAGVEGTVFAVVHGADGKVLVGGFFSRVGGQTRYCLARLNADGTLDPTFDTRGWANGYVFAIAERADGTVLVGGQFTYFGGRERANFARLNPDGSLDIFFHPQANGAVRALAMQPDGKVTVGGDFTQIGGQARDRLARLNADGTIDNSFRGGANESVRAVATQADGRTLVGGDFTLVNGRARNRLARLDVDGTLDLAFMPEPNGPVYAVEAQADGRAFVGGEFAEVGGQARTRVARLAAADTFRPGFMADPSFSRPNYGRYAVALQPDGRVLVGGSFRNSRGLLTNVARFNRDGTPDHSFDSRVGGSYFVHAIAVQADGKILVGGEFPEVEGRPRYYLARLNSDGSLDSTFSSFLQPTFTSVRIIAVQTDGRILVVGSFLQSAGQARNYIARVNADGTLDDSFNPNPNGQPRSLLLQPDGKILLGGGFTQVCGQVRRGLARLNADGTLDHAFNPNVSGRVYALALQGDGRLLIGGDFTSVGGVQRLYLARLHSDGTPDEFNPWNQTQYAVTSIALQANGKIIFGNRNGKYARLNADGTADPTYYLWYSPEEIHSVHLQADGRALVGSHRFLERMLNNEAALQRLSVKKSLGGSVSIVWSRGGAAPEVEQVTFEVSTDGHTYERVGEATRTSGGWFLNGVTLPQNRNIFVRARGTHLATGYFNETVSGTATAESVLQLILYSDPTDGPPTY